MFLYLKYVRIVLLVRKNFWIEEVICGQIKCETLTQIMNCGIKEE